MKLLVLDLDETLIYATEKRLDRPPGFTTKIYNVYQRPFVDEFLQLCSLIFQVGIWTTAGSDYAMDVVENLFPRDYSLRFVWSRERCTKRYDSRLMEDYYVKDLAKLKRKGFRLQEVVVVDDTPRKLERNYGNLVRIQEWRGDPNDRELLRLMKYLPVLSEVENVRSVEKRSWERRYTLD